VMAPEWLSSTYKRYKADTITFTSWLAGVAVDLGYQLDTSEPGTQKTTSKGSKDKASNSSKTAQQPAIKLLYGSFWAKRSMSPTIRALLSQAKLSTLRNVHWMHGANVATGTNLRLLGRKPWNTLHSRKKIEAMSISLKS